MEDRKSWKIGGATAQRNRSKRERERETRKLRAFFTFRRASRICCMLGINYGIILSANEPSPCRRFELVLSLSPPGPPMETGGKRRRSFRVAHQPEVVHFCPVSARISLMRFTVARFHCPRGPNIRRCLSFRARRWKWRSAVSAPTSSFFLRAENCRRAVKLSKV